MQHFDEEANLVRINSLLKCHFVIQAGVLFLWKRSSIRKGTQAGNETRDLNLQSNSSFIGKKVKNNSMLELDIEYKEQTKEFISKNEMFNIPDIPEQFLENFKENETLNNNSSSFSGETRLKTNKKQLFSLKN